MQEIVLSSDKLDADCKCSEGKWWNFTPLPQHRHFYSTYLLMLVWKPSTLVFTAVILSKIFSCGEKVVCNSLRLCTIRPNCVPMHEQENVPGWRHRSHFHLLFLGWGAESSMRPEATEVSLNQVKWLKSHIYSQTDSLTTMMVSLRATISGFTLSRSIMIFSLPLMKPHFGAEGQRGEISLFFFLLTLTFCADATKKKTLHLSSFSSHRLHSYPSPFPVRSVWRGHKGTIIKEEITKCNLIWLTCSGVSLCYFQMIAAASFRELLIQLYDHFAVCAKSYTDVLLLFMLLTLI